jgi:tetratricopeptide (TPR) repeat protein
MLGWLLGESLLLLLALGGVAAAQDSLVTIKTLYASAAYEDALTAIERLRSASPTSADTASLQEYRAFCLLALGREAEANKALEDLVLVDPFFAPDPSEVSPRVVVLFHTVRRRLLPTIVQQRYGVAKATFDRKEWAAAVEQFTHVVALLDDADLDQKTPGIGDLRTLAGGFLDLAKSAAAPPKEEPKPEPVPPAPPVKTVFDASDADVTPPVAQRQDIPTYNFPQPATGIGVPSRPGVLEIVIDEAGNVERAVMRQTVNAAYDPILLSAVINWHYKPALRNGTPVKYRKLIQVTVETRR